MAGLALTTVAQAASIGGTILSTVGAIQQGRAADAAAQYQARQLEQQAKTERAVAQREAESTRREKEQIISRARAVGAAGGGGVDLFQIGALEEEGTYREKLALWQGEEAGAGREAQAAASRYEGRSAQRAGFLNAGSTILSGATSFYDKYGAS